MKLKLKKETLAELTPDALRLVLGAAGAASKSQACTCTGPNSCATSPLPPVVEDVTKYVVGSC